MIEHSHIIHEKMVSLTIKIIEVDGVAPQLSRGGGGRFLQTVIGVSNQPLVIAKPSPLKNFTVLKDIEQYRSHGLR